MRALSQMTVMAAIVATLLFVPAGIAVALLLSLFGFSIDAVVTFGGEKPLVTDGPYGEVHELFNGFWIVDVATREEAIEWATRAPLGPGSKLEVRRMTDESDFADFADNEFIQKEKEWRAQGL